MTITEFLLARIDEDERGATAVLRDLESSPPSAYDAAQVPYLDAGDPDRVLAECGAKRRIVEELALPYIAERRRLMNGRPSWGDEHPDLLRLLALPYADHPDYREEWRV